jgi:aspartate/methionine/tyrosine aminotransferase
MNFETYPFEKLNELLKDIEPNQNLKPLTLTIGEPQMETPSFIQEELCKSSHYLRKYPKSAGEDILKDAQIEFVKRRFGVELKRGELIPTFGTREVLFNLPQFLLFDKKEPVMAFTNPFYQIYEGAAIASRAKIHHLNLTKENSFKALPTEYKDILQDTDLVIINFPNNPTAGSLSLDELCMWVEASLEYDFVLVNDECYSEIYCEKPDSSLLEACIKVGNDSFKNCLVLNSISKRSSAPGLRSGFIAGDETILKEYMKYRTYVGCAVPLPLQFASAKAWSDEEHVKVARERYKRNFELAKEILGVKTPNSTFYIWLEVEDDLEFTKLLYKEKNLKVIPGTFLSRGEFKTKHVRIALVEDEENTKEAILRIKELL